MKKERHRTEGTEETEDTEGVRPSGDAGFVLTAPGLPTPKRSGHLLQLLKLLQLLPKLSLFARCIAPAGAKRFGPAAFGIEFLSDDASDVIGQ